jgi:hypothetical protein
LERFLFALIFLFNNSFFSLLDMPNRAAWSIRHRFGTNF